MGELIKKGNEGELTVSSLTVAKEFDRNHKEVLRSIKNLIKNQRLRERDFALSSYKSKQGRSMPYYELTERGFFDRNAFYWWQKGRRGAGASR